MSSLDLKRKKLQLLELEQQQAAAAPAPEPAGDGLFTRSLDRLGKGLSDAGGELANMLPDAAVGDPYAPQEPSQSLSTSVRKAVGGDIIPAVGDVIGDAVMTGGEAILPESVQSGLKQAVQWATDSAPAKAVGKGLENWRKASPDTYDAAGDWVNIAGVMTPAKLPKSARGAKAKAGLEGFKAKRRRSDIEKALEPDDIIKARGAVTEEGLLNKRTYQPTDVETRMYDQVEKVKGVNPRASNLHNLNALEAEVDVKRQALDKDLLNAEPISMDGVWTDINAAIADTKFQPTLVGDAGKAAERIYGKFGELALELADEAGNIAPKDLLDARRKLDAWLRANDAKVFDNTGNARAIAVRSLRQKTNARVNAAAPNSKVAESLQQQADLLNARDILEPRASTEGASGLSRAVNKVEADTGLGPPRTPQATQSNLSSLPAMALTGAGTALSLGSRGLMDGLRAGKVGSAHLADMTINSATGPVAQAAAKAAALRAFNQEQEF